ncbi:MAG: YeiH family protein, partial [Eubacteriales bacterium]|nr:YeiH family protein [Eubacteriales bacterium]
AIAAVAWLIGEWLPVVGGPVFAILIGMLAAMLIENREPLRAGVSFTSKKVLQLAVILLGFGMNLSVIVSTGIQSLPIILSTIATSLLVAFILYRVMKIPTNTAVLIGVGSSICGGSAVAATAPVIDASDEEIAQAISVIFLFNIAAALIFPTLGGLLHLSDYGFGLFAGTAINDTSSVTAAASIWDSIHGSNALETATIVKMTRTLAIIPITLAIALYRAKKESGSESSFRLKKVFPMFILFFVLASVITTIAVSLGVPTTVFAPLKVLIKFFIVMAMAAIGLNTNLVSLIRKGGKPILVGFCCWGCIAIVSLLMQKVLGIW